MTIDSLGMIRRAWQDVAATVAPNVPGLAGLLDRRLEEAQKRGSLEETSLLAIVDAATQLAANAGAVAVAPALSKRLRRHLYEYLLSLDAAGDSLSERAGPGPTTPDGGGPLIGADEVAALGGDHQPSPDDWWGTAIFGAEAEALELSNEAAGASAAAPASPVEAVQPAGQDGSTGSGTPLPRFSFHIGDPNDMLAATPPPRDHESNGTRGALPELFAPLDLHPPAHTPAPRRTSFGDPSTWPTPVAPPLKGSRGPGTGSGRTGEPVGRPARRPTPPAGSDPGQQGPAENTGNAAVTRKPPSGVVAAPAVTALDAGAAAPGPAGSPRELEGDLPPSGPPSAARGEPGPERGLAIPSPFALGPDAVPPILPVSESDLAALRNAVEERLRKKRCDETAALLQRAAQDLGGQAVAAIALDAGDRCRTLGKPKAALNCYLAASRADPVFEAPLARLAEICIDDHDIDLAVSYLERIARLTRLRGDQRGALHIYRKIATIAPYRDDVLEMLMRAETSGRID